MFHYANDSIGPQFTVSDDQSDIAMFEVTNVPVLDTILLEK